MLISRGEIGQHIKFVGKIDEALYADAHMRSKVDIRKIGRESYENFMYEIPKWD